MNQNDNVGFYLYLSSYLCWCLFLLMASSYYLMCLRSAPRASFSISFKAGLLVVNFLSCCLSGNILISPFFLKDSLLGKEVFPFSCLSLKIFYLFGCLRSFLLGTHFSLIVDSVVVVCGLSCFEARGTLVL